MNRRPPGHASRKAQLGPTNRPPPSLPAQVWIAPTALSSAEIDGYMVLSNTASGLIARTDMCAAQSLGRAKLRRAKIFAGLDRMPSACIASGTAATLGCARLGPNAEFSRWLIGLGCATLRAERYEDSAVLRYLNSGSVPRGVPPFVSKVTRVSAGVR